LDEAMENEDIARTLVAIAEQGSRKSEPSAAIVALLSEFIREGKLRAVAEAFNLFHKAHRPNATIVESTIPAKILNVYFLQSNGIDATTFEKWSIMDEWRDWTKQITDALGSPPTFEAVVNQMRDELRAMPKVG
jgi:hypothetical protein